MGVAGLLGGKENRFGESVFWEPAIPADWNEKETFWKESWVLKSESSSGESGFLEKSKTNREVGFFDFHLAK